MKRPIMIMLAACILTSAIAQENAIKNPYKKNQLLVLHSHDFQTAQDLKNTSLNQVLKDNEWYKTSRMSPGLALNYFQGLTNHLDFYGASWRHIR